MNLISWNCRGLGSKGEEEAMRNLIRTENPDIVLIQETKLEENDFLHSSKMFWNKGGTKDISDRGALGGLGTLWNVANLVGVHTLPVHSRVHHLRV